MKPTRPRVRSVCLLIIWRAILKRLFREKRLTKARHEETYLYHFVCGWAQRVRHVAGTALFYPCFGDGGGEARHGCRGKVRRSILAGYLDRPDFVRQADGHQLLIDNTNNWAEPLDMMFARILAADLRQRMPSSIIVTEDNSTPPDVRFIIDANIERFNLVDTDHALLEGDFLIRDKAMAGKLQPVPVHLMVDAGLAPQATADSLSQLVGEFADNIVLKLGVLSSSHERRQN